MKIKMISRDGSLKEFDILEVAEMAASYNKRYCKLSPEEQEDARQYACVYLIEHREELAGLTVGIAVYRASVAILDPLKRDHFKRFSKNETPVVANKKNFYENSGLISQPREDEYDAKDLLEVAMERGKLTDDEKKMVRWYVEDCEKFTCRIKQGGKEYNSLRRGLEHVLFVMSKWYGVPFTPSKKWFRVKRFKNPDQVQNEICLAMDEERGKAMCREITKSGIVGSFLAKSR